MRRGILADIDELRQLRRRIGRRPFNRFDEALRKRCDLILETTPIREAQWRSLWHNGSWAAGLTAARSTQGRILDLLVAHAIDPNLAYRNRAIEELNNLLGWATWCDPCHRDLQVDLCTAETAVAVAIGIDWLWDDLSESDRLRAVTMLQDRAIEPYLRAVAAEEWWYTCYHAWNAVINGGIGLVALALAEEFPQAERAYRLARKGLGRFFDSLGKEGGWDEGTGYWGYAMRYVLLLGEAARRLEDDLSIFHARGMDQTGLFPVYFTPNGHPAGFGDRPAVPLQGAIYLLPSRYELPEVLWWLDEYSFHRDVSTTGWSAAGLAMMFRPADAPTDIQPKLEELKVFHQIGWAAIADRWPHPRMYVAAKTGDLAAHLSQRDMNSIQVQIDGRTFVVDRSAGQASWEDFAAPVHQFSAIQARSHNTIVVAEQDQQIDAQGRIRDEACTDRYRWVVCDAGHAVGENATFYRHVVMLVDPETGIGEQVIVLDEVEMGTPENFELYWHLCAPAKLDETRRAGSVSVADARMHFVLASNVKTELEAGTKSLGPRREDRYLCLRGGAMGPLRIATAFGREPLAGGLNLSVDLDGTTVQAGPTTLTFTSRGRHMALTDVRG